MMPRERGRSATTVTVAPAPQSALSKAPGPGPLERGNAHAVPLAAWNELAPVIAGCYA